MKKTRTDQAGYRDYTIFRTVLPVNNTSGLYAMVDRTGAGGRGSVRQLQSIGLMKRQARMMYGCWWRKRRGVSPSERS